MTEDSCSSYKRSESFTGRQEFAENKAKRTAAVRRSKSSFSLTLESTGNHFGGNS